MLRNAWLIPLLPAVSFALTLLIGKRLPRKGAELGIVAVGASFVMACVALVQWVQRVDDADGGHGGTEALRAFGRSLGATFSRAEGGHSGPVVEAVHRSFTWWQSGATKFHLGIQVDGLAVVMMFTVTLVSLLVHVYSTEYLRDDRRYTHYFAALNLFTASMLLLSVSDNTLGMLLGWEGTSLCSFMLIGHWWEEKANSDAALKAFFTTRAGDIGLLVGIVLCFFMAGSFDNTAINNAALGGNVSHTLVLLAACALFAGVVGKSGQFPLHTWLPDAMAGPTPVSALIHAATMVVAGVFLVARLYGVFWSGLSIDAGGVNLMAAIGGTTIIIGAALAFVQRDIKKVLAYSTISQLGYMVMGLGVGAWVAAVFHLFTHAFFKALLFLGAGSVSHSGSHHSFDMKDEMGGLRKHMPQTFVTFLIGSAALAGIFPLAGFWSKDEILATAGKTDFTFFMVVGLAGAFMTAAYMTRCVYLTFFGEYRGHGHPHESPATITVPLWVLAGLSVVAGFVNASAFHVEKFKEWFEPSVAFPSLTHPEFQVPTAVLSVGLALVAILVAYAYYWRDVGPHGATERSGLARTGYAFLDNRYYLDHLYTGVIVGGVKDPIARAAYWVNQNVIDGVVNGAGRLASGVGRLTYQWLDQRVVDGAVNGVALGTGETGGALRVLQSGRVQRYALLLVAAVGVLSLLLFLVN